MLFQGQIVLLLLLLLLAAALGSGTVRTRTMRSYFDAFGQVTLLSSLIIEPLISSAGCSTLICMIRERVCRATSHARQLRNTTDAVIRALFEIFIYMCGQYGNVYFYQRDRNYQRR